MLGYFLLGFDWQKLAVIVAYNFVYSSNHVLKLKFSEEPAANTTDTMNEIYGKLARVRVWWYANTASSALLQIMLMVTWIIILSTVFGSGVLAYLYYKVLNYFIRIKFESDDSFEPRPEPPRSRKFRAHDKEDDEIYSFEEINKMQMKIHRSWNNWSCVMLQLQALTAIGLRRTYERLLL